MSVKYVYQPYCYSNKWRIVKGKIVKRKGNQLGGREIKGIIIKTNDKNTIMGPMLYAWDIYDKGSIIDEVYDSWEELVEKHFTEILQ